MCRYEMHWGGAEHAIRHTQTGTYTDSALSVYERTGCMKLKGKHVKHVLSCV